MAARDAQGQAHLIVANLTGSTRAARLDLRGLTSGGLRAVMIDEASLRSKVGMSRAASFRLRPFACLIATTVTSDAAAARP